MEKLQSSVTDFVTKEKPKKQKDYTKNRRISEQTEREKSWQRPGLHAIQLNKTQPVTTSRDDSRSSS